MWRRLWPCLWRPEDEDEDDEDEDEEDGDEDESELEKDRIESDELERPRWRCPWRRWWREWLRPSLVLLLVSVAAALPVSVRGTGMNAGAASTDSWFAFIHSWLFKNTHTKKRGQEKIPKSHQRKTASFCFISTKHTFYFTHPSPLVFTLSFFPFNHMFLMKLFHSAMLTK